MNRALRLVALLSVAVLSLTACGGASVVPASDVEAQAEEQFSQQFPVDAVACDEDLPAEVDAEIVCTLESEGKTFEMTVTVTSVDGDDVNFDLELTDEL